VTGRLDVTLVDAGMARSRQHAKQLIQAGLVEIGTDVVRRPAAVVTDVSSVRVVAEQGYVSRAGDKLAQALDHWEIEVTGRRCLDVGASTGGFTDVLLRRGAASVVALDVGHGQMDPGLAADPRVEIREGVNARDLVDGSVEPRPQLVVVDLSFISLRLVLDPLVQVAGPDADLVVLVKPQFEVGRAELGARGVVRDEAARRRAVEQVIAAAGDLGLGAQGLVASAVQGKTGNQEYVLWLSAGRGRDDLVLSLFGQVG
jgi:23S rRNA (cytidine1920-2'-O)/16S rRNA (cytidine1409-2'-O)-methyltransferase